ncbi:MAG: DUF3164 family protein [Comamonas sp.]
MSEERTIPTGYWENANGALIPVSKIKDIDKDRHRTVIGLIEVAKRQQAQLADCKAKSFKAIEEFIDRSAAQYEVAVGGAKGNVSLMSFDGKYKVQRQVSPSIQFDERLQAAKVLIDECIQGWSKGSNANIRALINDAFQVDQAGKISTGRVLGLRRLKIDDEQWRQAMDLISDSMLVVDSKAYIRFYERDAEGKYQPISLDIAA